LGTTAERLDDPGLLAGGASSSPEFSGGGGGRLCGGGRGGLDPSKPALTPLITEMKKRRKRVSVVKMSGRQDNEEARNEKKNTVTCDQIRYTVTSPASPVASPKAQMPAQRINSTGESSGTLDPSTN
jgi:hypothetical protein